MARKRTVEEVIEQVEGKMEVEPVAQAAPDVKKESDTMAAKKNGSNGNGAVEVVLQAQFERRMLHVKYTTEYSDGTVIQRPRSILPSHSYETKDGNICVVGYDSYRKEIRTFRLDRMNDVQIGEVVPAKKLDDGHTVLYPATYRLRFAKPTVSNGGKDKYLASGWSEQPIAQVLRPSA